MKMTQVAYLILRVTELATARLWPHPAHVTVPVRRPRRFNRDPDL